MRTNKAATNIFTLMILLIVVVISSTLLAKELAIFDDNNNVDNVKSEPSKIVPIEIEFYRQDGLCGTVFIRNLSHKDIILDDPIIYLYSSNRRLLASFKAEGKYVLKGKSLAKVCFPLTDLMKKYGRTKFVLEIGGPTGVFDTYYNAKVSPEKIASQDYEGIKDADIVLFSKENEGIVYLDKNRDWIFDGEYSNITDAISDASSGSRIILFGGVYNENITVRGKTLEFYGSGCYGKPVVKGNIVFVSPPNDYDIVIKGIDFNPSGTDYGIMSFFVNNTGYSHTIRIMNTNISYNKRFSGGYGIIYVNGSGSDIKVVISNNKMELRAPSISSYVIKLDGIKYGHIIGNDLDGGLKYKGIYIKESSNVFIEDNKISGMWYAGAYVISSDNIRIKNNLIRNIRNRICWDAHGVYLFRTNNAWISDNIVKEYNKFGIRARDSNNILIASNMVSDDNPRCSYAGINVFGYSLVPENITIVHNVIHDISYMGIEFNKLKNVFVGYNIIYDTGRSGIDEKGNVEDFRITGNWLNSTGGLTIVGVKSGKAFVTDNIVMHSKQIGLDISWFSGDVMIVRNNTIVNGTWLTGLIYSPITNLVLINNTFANNSYTMELYIRNAPFNVKITKNVFSDNGITPSSYGFYRSLLYIYARNRAVKNLSVQNNTFVYKGSPSSVYFLYFKDNYGVTNGDPLNLTGNSWLYGGRVVDDEATYEALVYDHRDDSHGGYIITRFYIT